MSAIDSAFSSEGPMKTKNIHVGNVFVYNNLSVEDKATFESDVEFQGSVITQKGIKIGNTLFTEDKLNAQASGVNGVVADASTAPASKKLKLETKTANSNHGIIESNDMSDKANYVQAKGVVSQDQVFSHTGFATVDGKASTYITPNYVATSGLAVDNLYTRKFDPDVTSGGKTDEINVQAQTFRVRTLGAVGSGNAIKIDDDININGQVGDLKVDSVTVDDGQGGGALTVKGATNFLGNVTFVDTTGGLNTPTIVIPKLSVTDLTVTGKTIGGGNSSDTITTDKIEVKTKGKSIEIADPVNGLEVVVNTEQAKWDATQSVFYRIFDWKTNDTVYDYHQYNEYKICSDEEKQLIDNYFDYSNGFDRQAFLHLTHWHFCFSKTDDLIKSEQEGGKNCGIISPITVNNFSHSTSLSKAQTLMAYIYNVHTGELALKNGLFNVIYDKFKSDNNFLIKFMKFVNYVFQSSYPVYGITSFVLNSSTNTVTILPEFLTSTDHVWTSVSIDCNTMTYKKCKGSFSIDIADETDEEKLICFKNILEGLFMGMYITIITDEMRKRTTDTDKYYTILKINSNNSDYGVVKPMDNTKSQFDKMNEYIENWHNAKYWDIIWNKLVKFIEEHIRENKEFTFLDNTTDDTRVAKFKEVLYPDYFEWIKEEQTDSIVDIEYLVSPTQYIMKIGKPTINIRYTCEHPYLENLEVKNITGNTTVGGTLKVDNITAINEGDTINISNANFETVTIGGTKVTPTPNNTECHMEFAWQKAYLFANKSLTGQTIEKYKESVTNEDGNPEDINIPEVYIDINNCGQIAFVTVRPFTIQRKPLIEKYISPTVGLGIIYLPIDAFNPYGLPNIAKANVARGILYEKNINYDPDAATNRDTQKSITANSTPSKNNIYEIAKTKWQWIKCEVVTDTSKKITTTKYVVWQEGTVSFIVSELYTKFVNLQWNDALKTDTYTPTTGYKLYREYVYIEGFRFVAPKRNEDEKLSFYKDTDGI